MRAAGDRSGGSVAAKNSEEEDKMLVDRMDYAKTPTAKLHAEYKKTCAQTRDLIHKADVLRAELNARQQIADAEAKVVAAKADHAKALDTLAHEQKGTKSHEQKGEK